MTDKELRSQRKPDLLKMLREQESEIICLTEQNRKLNRQFDDLMSAMSGGAASPRRIEAAPRPARETADLSHEREERYLEQASDLARLNEKNMELRRRMDELLISMRNIGEDQSGAGDWHTPPA